MKFWNQKPLGIIGAFLQFLVALWLQFKDRISTLFLTLNLGECGKNCIIKSSVIIRYPKQISLADNIYINRDITLNTEIPSAYLRIGNNTRLAKKCIIDFSGNLEIGNFCVLAENVKIITHHHGSKPLGKAIPLPLVIEDNVFIGTNTTILHNVNFIGKNSSIGAGSIVTKDVPPNVVVAGNPAKIIKSL